MTVINSAHWNIEDRHIGWNERVRNFYCAYCDLFSGGIATWESYYSAYTPSKLPSSDSEFISWVDVLKLNFEASTALTNFLADNTDGGFILEDAATDFINTYADKTVHLKDGFYHVNINRVMGGTATANCGTNSKKYLIKMQDTTINISGSDIATTQTFDYSYTYYTIALTEVENEVNITIAANHQPTIGANYDIFMCPLGGSIDYINKDGTAVTATIDNSATRAMISALMRELVTGSSGMLYDVQWLPYGYCKRSELPTIDTTGSIKGLASDGTASLIYTRDSSEKPVACGAIYWCSSAQSNFTINKELIPANNTTNLIENRIKQETMKYRLVSPNWANGFDFSAVNNDGLAQIDIYCTFKPFQPYIRVAPHFKNLYGAAYNDSRGLILGGEFSVEQVTDAWQQYQLNNKNYQAIFDRQMKTLDLQQKVAAENDTWNLVGSITGGVASTIGNTLQGAMFGGVAGGVAAGVANTLGMGADIAQSVRNYQNAAALRDDARSAALDNFQYQIGNIQAQPLGLSRVDSFNIDYRVYPLIEVYTCTTEELQNLRDSIKWNGIDIGQMSTIEFNTLRKHLTDTTTELNYVSAALIVPMGGYNNVPTAEWLALCNTLQSGIYTKNE